MRIYSIPTPEKLFDISDSIKWDEEYRNTMSFANKWFKDRAAYTVTLEFSKTVIIMVDDGTTKKPLATVYTAAARDFIKELREIEDHEGIVQHRAEG